MTCVIAALFLFETMLGQAICADFLTCADVWEADQIIHVVIAVSGFILSVELVWR